MANADRIIELLHEAKGRPAGAERARFLKEACGEDSALKEQIISLLEADAVEGESDFLKITRVIRPGTLPIEKPGDRIGRYKLLEQIGEGGCGVVYMAEQEEPVRRRVALKVIKLGMDTKQVIARFEAERQALAMMDHPNIAKVLDAGATETGRPFFVMELVRGIRITDYCDQNNLSTRERIELFIQVCQAIQHAHQKGIIHRDLKPSNILVTQHDDVAVPKVIDFGISKATVGQLTDKTVFTAFAQFVGTPAYMSPEQAQMSGLDVDTRADIYSLGVLLYELLTGNTPFDAKELLAAGMDEMRRKIREDEPAKPSTRLSTMQVLDLTTVARRRHVEPPRLIHLIRGDLDWLVMKCLEKDRVRRYETANALAMDLQRHLDNEPVVARPPSNLYRFQKFVRRNKLAFAAGAIVLLVLLGGIAASTWQAIRATRAEQEQSRLRKEAEGEKKIAQTEATKSRQVAQFMKDLLRGVGPSATLDRNTTMLREVLDQTASRLNDLKGQPAVEAELRTTLGNVYSDLGEYTNAVVMHREALALRKKLLGDENPEVANSLSELARVLGFQGRFHEEETIYREALAMRRKLLGDDHLDVANSFDNVAGTLNAQGNWGDAETMWREALAIRRKRLGNENASVAFTLHPLACLLKSRGQLAESEALSREELAIWRKLYGNAHPNVGWALGELTIVLREQAKLSEAETILQEALAIQRKQSGGNPSDVASLFHQLAWVIFNQGKGAEAEKLSREALAMRRKLFGDEHPEVASTLAALAAYLRDQRKLPEAEITVREAIAIQRKRLGDGHPDVAGSVNLLSELLSEQDKLTELESVLQDQFRRETSGTESAQLQLGHLLWQKGDLHLKRNDFTNAEQVYEQALQTFKQLQTRYPENRYYRQEQGYSHRLLGYVLIAAGRVDEAVRHYRAAIDLYAALAVDQPANMLYSRDKAYTTWSMAQGFESAGRPDAAAVEYRQAITLFEKAIVDFPNEAALRALLADVLARQGNYAKVKTLYLQAAEHADAGTLNQMAWRLATAPDANLRDGPAAVSFAEKAVAASNRKNALLLDTLAAAYAEIGQFTNAVGVQQEAIVLLGDETKKKDYALRLELYKSGLPYRDHADLARRVSALLIQGKFAEAEPLARECLALREKQIPDDWLTFNARSMLGGSLLGQKKYAEAGPLLLSACEGMNQREDRIPANGKIRLQESLQRLVQLYEATGQSEKAAEWNRKLSEFEQAEAERKHPTPKP